MVHLNLKSSANNKGIGLLELMLSLSIIAILLMLATRYYLTTSYAQKLNQLSEQIATVQGAIYTWKGGQNSYEGLETNGGKALIDQGLIAKADQDNSGTKIITPWGSEIIVKSIAPFAKATITFTTNGVEEAHACKNIAASLRANADDDSIATCTGSDSKEVFIYTFP